MKLLAHFSEDSRLVEAFRGGEDIHGVTAKDMFKLECSAKEVKKKFGNLRQIAKSLNFGLMYGMGASKLYDTLAEEDAVDEEGNPITKEKAQEYFDLYFDTYSGVGDFIKNQKKLAHKNEFIYTLIGRKRRLKEINGRDYKIVSYEERLAVNACIQGSAADLMMMCQPKIEADKRLKEMRCTMRMQIHDELVFVCPDEHLEEAMEIIKEYMEHAMPKELNVPITVEGGTGKSYAESK